MNYDLKYVFGQFRSCGDFIEAAPYGSGHINDTFLVTCKHADSRIRYIIQRINHYVFKEPEKLMDNIYRISVHLHKKFEEAGDPDISRRFLKIIPERSGKPYYRDIDGNYWRCYLFIEGALGYEVLEDEEQAFQAAGAFGEFLSLLTDLPGSRLNETIQDFHNTPLRFKKFKKIVEEDPFARRAGVNEEIDFFLSMENEASRLIDLQEKGLIFERITHNDTKLNNILLDTETKKATCVIDLDTSMPGLIPYDFGDMVRTFTSPAMEDEKDTSEVFMQMNIFKALTKGFLSTTANFLTEVEKDNLVFGGKLITCEVGLRFLTDYLEGDKYFKIKYDKHNLVRSRTQIALVRSIEKSEDKMKSFVNSEYNRIISGEIRAASS
ncbi:MAG: aminoglycoside phosphotransferase family protein [Acidobacteriota bacterium]